MILCLLLRIDIPKRLQHGPAGWNVVEVLEGEFAKIATDVSIPTDRQLEACKPDIVAYLKDKWMILIMEMAWAWEPLVAEKEESKKAIYWDLVVDLSNQYQGWKVFNLPLVVGCLGTMHSFVGELQKVGLFGELDLQQIAREAQSVS